MVQGRRKACCRVRSRVEGSRADVQALRRRQRYPALRITGRRCSQHWRTIASREWNWVVMIEARTVAQHSPFNVVVRARSSCADAVVSFPFFDQNCIVHFLNLAFATKALRSLCEDKSIAERELGMESAGRLRRRLADLRAARSLADLLAGGLVQDLWPATYELSFRLSGSSLVLRVNHHAVPIDDLGNIDWKRVTRVKIVRIEKRS